MKRAVVLLSGGVDSATTLAIAKADGYDIYALSFEYGQRHKRELESARGIARELGAARHLTISFNMRDIGGSALTDEIEVPKGVQSNDIPVTYVPARNTIFLSFALAWAETLEAEAIYIGANAVDYSGYPDCRPEFIKAFEDVANLATKVSVEGKVRFKVHAPLIRMTKAEIIRKGKELGVDYSLTWSCYDPQMKQGPGGGDRENSHLVPCLRCDSCRLRAKGFKEAGIEDPLLLKE